MNIYIGVSESVNEIPDIAKVRIKELSKYNADILVGAKTKGDFPVINMINTVKEASLKVYVEDKSLPEKSDYNDLDDDPDKEKEFQNTSTDEIQSNFEIPGVQEERIIKIAPRQLLTVQKDERYIFPADDKAMLNSAESGFFIWDGMDERIFMNILELSFYKKPVEIVLNDALIKIESPEDVKQLVSEPGKDYTASWNILPEKFYKKAVKEVVPSKYMRDYLLKYKSAPKATVLELINSSPIELTKKLKLLKEFSVTDDERYELIEKVCKGRKSFWCEGVEGLSHDIHRYQFTYHVNLVSVGLDALKLSENEFFVLKRIDHKFPGEKAGGLDKSEKIKNWSWTEAWKREEKNKKSERLGEFSSYEKMQEFLRSYITNEKITIDSLCLFKLEKWVPNPNYIQEKYGNKENWGWEFDNPYSYYFILEKPVFFGENHQRKDGSWYEGIRIFNYDSMELVAPYSVGDIIKIDCRPFAPVTYALMLEDGESCGRGLYRTHDNKWKPHFFNRYHPFIIHDAAFPPYYGVSLCEEELPEEYKIFEEVQEKIGGDENKAQNLLRHIMNLEETEFSDGITGEEFFGLLKTDWVNIEAPTEEEISLKYEANLARKEKEDGAFVINIDINIGQDEEEN